jgi:hypothetical protein
MKQPEEVAPGVWALFNDAEQYSYVAVFGESQTLLVGPGEPHPLEEFAVRMGAETLVVVDLLRNEQDSPMSHPEGVPLPLPGWTLISLPGVSRLAVHNAGEHILLCGDQLSDVRVPSILHGSQEYLDCLDAIEKLGSKLVVPSRGTTAKGKREVRARVERDRAYIAALRRHVETSRQSGVSLDLAIEVARSVYADYPFVEQHVENVQLAWEE